MLTGRLSCSLSGGQGGFRSTSFMPDPDRCPMPTDLDSDPTLLQKTEFINQFQESNYNLLLEWQNNRSWAFVLISVISAI
jgi:hypothetical protein